MSWESGPLAYRHHILPKFVLVLNEMVLVFETADRTSRSTSAAIG